MDLIYQVKSQGKPPGMYTSEEKIQSCNALAFIFIKIGFYLRPFLSLNVFYRDERLDRSTIHKFNGFYHRSSGCFYNSFGQSLLPRSPGHPQKSFSCPFMVEPFEFIIFNSAIDFCDLSQYS